MKRELDHQTTRVGAEIKKNTGRNKEVTKMEAIKRRDRKEHVVA